MIGAMASVAERAAELVFDKEMTGERFLSRVKAIAYNNLAMNPVPQLVKPITDLYANKNSFTGRPIETMGMERLEPEYRFTGSTSMVARGLSTATGGMASPVQIDHMVQGYFGWLGGTVASTSMYAVMPFKEGEYPDTKWMDKASLGFVKSLPSNMSQYTTAFYENNKQIQQAFADMRHYSEIGEMDKVQEIMEEKGDKIALQKLYTQTSKQMANIRKQISVVTNDKSMDGATKREEIDRMKELISMLAKQAEDTRKSYN
jgi:hypothetical protein